ncbi:MAG: ferredoxin [Halobellus sp.]
MTTEYRIRLDRAACDGVFACLVRDDRFVEADDGLAAIDPGEGGTGVAGASEGDEIVVEVADDRRDDAEAAARACPFDAIAVTDVAQSGATDAERTPTATDGGDR